MKKIINVNKMFCDKCGNKVDENTKYCDKCGAKIISNQNSPKKIVN